MRLPYIPQTQRLVTKPLVFSGLNKSPIIDDIELSDGKSLDSDNLPAISPRKPLKTITTLTTPTDLYVMNNKLVYVDGTSFIYDGVVKGTVTAGVKSMVEFNGKIVIFPDKKYYDFISDTFGTMTCPYDIDYATVHYNRIFGIKGSDIYASKVGEYDTWADYSGTELDSWATDVGSEGNFTGITSYQDHIVFFKQNYMYELYGYTPSQFRVLEVAKVGCVDNKSISEVGGVLFFMGEAGIYAYSGGFPRVISEKLQLNNIESAKAGGDGRKLYVSVNGYTYIFDTLRNTFMPYMDDCLAFAQGKNVLYALGTDKKVYEIGAGTDPVVWEAVTKEYDEGVFNKLSLKSVKLRMKMKEDSEVHVWVKLDGREWIEHKIIAQSLYDAHREVICSIPMKRSTIYQIKLTGQGEALIYGEREYYVGSDKA